MQQNRSWSAMLGVTLIVSLLASSVVATYNYGDALHKSLLFYQAQRSGKLTNMAPELSWRKDSCLDDKGENGEDLSGGYYDGGGYMKFGFPGAFSMTMLCWGVLSHKAGYEKSGQLAEAYRAIRWGTDYFLKAHVGEHVFYGQVGDGDADRNYWGRPEDMKIKRPAYRIDLNNPGSDLAGEASAACAAASIVFKDVDAAYSNKLLTHSKQLFYLANNKRGHYHDSIKGAKNFYKSSDYKDEIVWAATWIAKATKQSTDLQLAEKLYDDFKLKSEYDEFNWDSKEAGVDVLLFELTKNNRYKHKVQKYCDRLMSPKQKRTPKGLVFLRKSGSLPAAANAAYIFLQAADLGIKSEQYRTFAKRQIDYMLGDGGRSYVVGFGKNYPTRPRHASSSCPAKPKSCGREIIESKEPNANVLYGALVGGPDENDNYTDDRKDNGNNEVSVDYNAGFTGCLACFCK